MRHLARHTNDMKTISIQSKTWLKTHSKSQVPNGMQVSAYLTRRRYLGTEAKGWEELVTVILLAYVANS